MLSADEEIACTTWQMSLWFVVLHISPSSIPEGLAILFAGRQSSVMQIELSACGALLELQVSSE